MTKFFVYPYLQNSKSAIALTEELGGMRVLRTGSGYKYDDKEHVLINWGCGECPHPHALNAKIMPVINKLKFYDRLSGTSITPAYATTKFEAESLGYPVFCRISVEGKDGEGIVVADCNGQLVAAPLYVKGIDKAAEWRVHVGRDYNGVLRLIGGSPKTQKPIEPTMTNVPTDKRVWSGDTTYFGNFTEGNGIPSAVTEVALKAMEKFPELAFLALDVVYSNDDKAYVIEGNSAPMMTQKTREAYGRFFKLYAEQKELANVAKTAAPVVPPAPVDAPAAAAPVRTKEEIAADLAKNFVEFMECLIPARI